MYAATEGSEEIGNTTVGIRQADDLNTSGPQLLLRTCTDAWVGVACHIRDTTNPRSDDRLGAGGGSTVERAGFEGRIELGARAGGTGGS
jgi:hypothetical protein